ncbi:MAG: hypothetical protein M0T85_01710 [Dehalococcoidales bacterium]|nr:hypothetical protein [Dehalococcoidales bacterium]
MERDVERNPFGVDLGSIITPLILLGVAALVLKNIDKLPGHDNNQTVGTGDSKGDQSDGSRLVPRESKFAINSVELSPSVLRPGQSFEVTWKISHIGPGGTYIAGLGLSPIHPLCLLGQHNEILQTVETDITVGDDPVFTSYSFSATAEYISGGATLLATYNYVRDSRGEKLKDFWVCSGVAVSPW